MVNKKQSGSDVTHLASDILRNPKFIKYTKTARGKRISSCTIRSRIASAIVSSPIFECQPAGENCEQN